MVTRFRATSPIDLRAARIRRLADELAPALECDTVLVDVDRLGNVDDWRAAVRKAARDRGWHVRTGTCGAGTRAWATRTDREVTPYDPETVAGTVAHAPPLLTPVDPA